MKKRVVVTGMGVVSPIGSSLEGFEKSLREGRSGIRFQPELEKLQFGCHVAGVAEAEAEKIAGYFSEEQRIGMNSNILFASVAALDAWKDAGFEVPSPNSETVDWDCGALIGTGIGGMDTIGGRLVPMTDAGKVRRLGSTIVEQVMMSGISAKVGGLLGLGGQVTSNSCACSTGTEAIAEAARRIEQGLSVRMLAGGSEGVSVYAWAGFDAMRVLNKNHNQFPEKASRPMSASAGGFIPGSGAGILMLENLESAEARGARIYAEIIGKGVNCGGQRMGGSMTAPNPTGVERCIREALRDAEISGSEVDAINGHLTATFADPYEIKNWQNALQVPAEKFPLIHATKSLIGHALGAAGGLEAVACVIELFKQFIHGSVNCEDVHENIREFERSIVHETRYFPRLRIMAKASFGFGDVNSCLIFKKWEQE
ncbi:MAG: beta-ketoacyl-[acyl-carrier-protein] synthase family protein [Desulfobacterales bacterium]|nr:beta-ketoacyl-[acyl-carrier-protein] synthase family protein [Desulfobacterales bacterium]